MNSLEIEFEIQKVIMIALSYGLTFYRRQEMILATFDVFDEYFLDKISIKVAVVQWTGESWACILADEASFSVIERIFTESDSPYFWEISRDNSHH